MDIPRRKNRQHSDKLTAELLFFCLWLTRCGEVELGCFESYGLENCGQHSPSSYRRYAKELEKCGAIPRMKLRGNNTDGNNRRRFISDPPVEDFAPVAQPCWHGPQWLQAARVPSATVLIAASTGHQCQPRSLKARAARLATAPKGSGGMARWRLGG